MWNCVFCLSCYISIYYLLYYNYYSFYETLRHWDNWDNWDVVGVGCVGGDIRKRGIYLRKHLLVLILSDSDRIQTCNLLIRSQMLYSVELRSHISELRVQRYGFIFNLQNIRGLFLKITWFLISILHIPLYLVRNILFVMKKYDNAAIMLLVNRM